MFIWGSLFSCILFHNMLSFCNSSWLHWETQALAFANLACLHLCFGHLCCLFGIHPRYQTLQWSPPGWALLHYAEATEKHCCFFLDWCLCPWCRDVQGDGGPRRELLPQLYPLEHSSPRWPHPFPCHPQDWLPHTISMLPWSMGELLHAQS